MGAEGGAMRGETSSGTIATSHAARLRGARSVLLASAATLLAVLATSGTPPVSDSPPVDGPEQARRLAVCTFTNPGYSGECLESTGIEGDSTADQACRAILDCLNNPRCVTTYCNASTLRSGWVLEKSEER